MNLVEDYSSHVPQTVIRFSAGDDFVLSYCCQSIEFNHFRSIYRLELTSRGKNCEDICSLLNVRIQRILFSNPKFNWLTDFVNQFYVSLPIRSFVKRQIDTTKANFIAFDNPQLQVKG